MDRYYVEHSGSDGPGQPRPVIGHCGVMEHAGLQEANWPTACRMEITVAYKIDQLPRDLWQRSLARALGLWEAAIGVRFKVLAAFTKQARIWITDGPLPGGTLAWSFLATNDCDGNLTLVKAGVVANLLNQLSISVGFELQFVELD